jgi:hypothetical protein
MRHLSAFLLIVILIGMPSCKYFKKDNKAKTMAIMKAQADSIRVADSLKKIQDQIMNARLDSARKADEERLAFDAAHKYNIIVGSFLTPEYAKGLSEEYRSKGYEPKILKKEGSKFEFVSIEAFDSFKKAFAKLKQYQDTVQFEAWLYVKK